MIGLTLRGKGFYWEDYKALLPQFRELIEAVLIGLEVYSEEENMTSTEKTFQNFLTPPPKALTDPG